jgi:hypothetical protein
MPTMIQTDPPRPARETLPTMYDLPSEEIGDAGLRETQLRHRAEQAEQTAEQERRRAERLAELLRQLGQDPDQV